MKTRDDVRPFNAQAVKRLADRLLVAIADAPGNSTILLRVVIDPQRRVSKATKITPEIFPLQDSECELDSV